LNLAITGRSWANPARRAAAEQIWVTEIHDQCLRARVPFFFKQWGGTNKKKAGRVLEGRTWDEMPVKMNWVKA
jgi:protein gp37